VAEGKSLNWVHAGKITCEPCTNCGPRSEWNALGTDWSTDQVN